MLKDIERSENSTQAEFRPISTKLGPKYHFLKSKENHHHSSVSQDESKERKKKR